MLQCLLKTLLLGIERALWSFMEHLVEAPLSGGVRAVDRVCKKKDTDPLKPKP